VDDLKVIDGLVGPGIDDPEGKFHFLPSTKHLGHRGQLERVFRIVGNSQDELHPTAGARARFIGTYVFIHGTDVIELRDWSYGRSRRFGVHGALAPQR